MVNKLVKALLKVVLIAYTYIAMFIIGILWYVVENDFVANEDKNTSIIWLIILTASSVWAVALFGYLTRDTSPKDKN